MGLKGVTYIFKVIFYCILCDRLYAGVLFENRVYQSLQTYFQTQITGVYYMGLEYCFKTYVASILNSLLFSLSKPTLDIRNKL